MVKFFPGGEKEASNYTKSCSNKFTPICPFCGRISETKISPNQLSRLHGISCVCNDGISIPNKIIRAIMEQAFNKSMISSYEKEHKEYDENGILRRFDMKFFDINGNPFFVEMDGGFHGEIKRKHSNKKMKFLPAKMFIADIMKDNIAENLGIPLIRIDCYKSDIEYIKQNLYDSELANIINLNNIDWTSIENICFSNIMRDVCIYKNEHPKVFVPEIAKKFELSDATIRNYLKRGTKLGICNYNPQEESKRRNSLNTNWHQSVGVYVENLDTGESWEFKTKTDFCNESQYILDGDKITKSMLEKRIGKANKEYIIYDSGEHDYLIWMIRRKK